MSLLHEPHRHRLSNWFLSQAYYAVDRLKQDLKDAQRANKELTARLARTEHEAQTAFRAMHIYKGQLRQHGIEPYDVSKRVS